MLERRALIASYWFGDFFIIHTSAILIVYIGHIYGLGVMQMYAETDLTDSVQIWQTLFNRDHHAHLFVLEN